MQPPVEALRGLKVFEYQLIDKRDSHRDTTDALKMAELLNDHQGFHSANPKAID